MNFCIACGMPMNEPKDYGCEDTTKQTCIHCTNQDGTVKSCDEIFNGGVEFFIGATGSSQLLAEKLVRKNMRSLPYWQDINCKCLEGEIATDEEFAQALSKLS